ncbi:MAG TPA: hypothetical protein VIF10_00005, partial [Methylobacter sp.]
GCPLSGIQRMKQDGWGRRRHWLPRNFCRLLGLGCPKQAFAKIAALSKGKDQPNVKSTPLVFKI